MSDQPVPQDENQIIAERRAKLSELRRRGTAFPNDFTREHLAADLHGTWGAKSNEEIEPRQVMARARICSKCSGFSVLSTGGGPNKP